MAKKEKDRTDIAIEGNVATWTLNSHGAINGTYIGTFKFKCFLHPSDTMAAGRMYRELLGPNPTLAAQHESFLAYALSQLKYRVVSAPPFWSERVEESNLSGDIADDNVITEILNAAIDAEILYKKQINSAKAQAIKHAKAAAEKMISEQNNEDDGESEEDTN